MLLQREKANCILCRLANAESAISSGANLKVRYRADLRPACKVSPSAYRYVGVSELVEHQGGNEVE